MANSNFTVNDGLHIRTTAAAPGATTQGDVVVDTVSGDMVYHNGSASAHVATASNTLVVTNKSIDASANTLTNIANAAIAAGAAIAYSKLNLTGSVVNADINSAAAISYSKLALTGSIVNADVSASAAVAYSKLNLATSILNTDISASAAIAYSKLALTGSIVNTDVSASAAIAYSKLNLAGAVKLASDVTGVLPIANGGTASSTSTQAFNTLAPATATGGLIVGTGTNTYGNLALGTTNQVPISNGTTVTWATLQQGAKNYITFNNFENNATTGWSLGTVGTLTNGIPTGTPTFGSGASGNLSFTAVNTNVLAGSYSGSLISSAATTAGNMLATQSYEIDAEDQAKVLTFKFYYNIPSGAANGNFSGTSSNSFGIAIYDVTNSQWLSSTANFGMTQSSGAGYVTGTCQTNSTTANLRFVIYNVNATAGAITVNFDDFYLGPQTAPIGYCGTDWTSYTPTTQGFGTSPIINYAQWRRVGDSIQIQASVTTGTTPTATLAEISLPSGLTVHSSISQNTAVAYFGVNTNVATSFQVNVNASNSTFLTFGRQDATNNGLTNANGSTLFGSAETFSFTTAPIKINGLSSNVQMSSDTDTRVVEAKAKATGTRTPTTSKAVNYDTVLSDTHGALTTVAGDTTGWKFTAPISGFYVVDGVYYISAGATSATMYVYINGTQDQALGSAVSTNTIQSFSATVKLNAGDFIDIRSDSTPTTGNASNLNQICVKRLSGPSVIAATESVNAMYGLTTGGSVSANTVIKYDTKVKDSHNAYSVSTGLFTAPVSGEYDFTVATNPGAVSNIYFKINGTAKGIIASPSSASVIVNGSASWPLNAGDTVGIYTDTTQTIGGSGGLGYGTYFAIKRVGN